MWASNDYTSIIWQITANSPEFVQAHAQLGTADDLSALVKVAAIV